VTDWEPNDIHPNEVEVCADCLTASCWQGDFMCETARTADVTIRTVAELRQLALESPEAWALDRP
jgi:hypothetical protein